MKSSFVWLILTGSLIFALSGCAQGPNTNCYSVCDDRTAVDCPDIEPEACYNLCDALMQKSTECAEATEALSLCQLEQTWVCSDTGPSLHAPIACQTEEEIQLAFCIDPPNNDESSDD